MTPSPLGGEGGSRSETDKGDVFLILDRRDCGHSRLIRQASPNTFSPEGRRA